MKILTTILAITLCLNNISLTAQAPLLEPFDDFEKSISKEGYELGDIIFNCFQTSKEELVYTLGYYGAYSTYPSGLNFYEDVIHKNSFTIKKRDKNLHLIAELDATEIDLPEVSARIVNGIQEEEAGFEVFGSGFIDNDFDSIRYFITTLDSNLNPIESRLIIPPVSRLSFIFDAKKNKAGNYVLLGHPKDSFQFGYNFNTRLLIEMSPTGEVLHFVDSLPSQTGISGNNLGFLCLSDGGCFVLPKYRFDANFNLSLTPAIYFDKGEKIEENEEGELIFAGVEAYPLAGHIYHREVVFSIDTANVMHTLLRQDVQTDNPNSFVRTGFRNFSAKNKNQMFAAFALDDLGSFADNVVHVFSFNLDNEILWEHTYGGNATYRPMDVFTMSDGAIFTFWKLYIEDNDYKSDVVYLRYDAQGMISEASEPMETKNEVVAYPNPSQNTLHIDLGPQLKNPSLRLFDSYGRLVLETKLQDLQSQIDVAHLASGVYMYQIWSESAIVQGGKVLKM